MGLTRRPPLRNNGSHRIRRDPLHMSGLQRRSLLRIRPHLLHRRRHPRNRPAGHRLHLRQPPPRLLPRRVPGPHVLQLRRIRHNPQRRRRPHSRAPPQARLLLPLQPQEQENRKNRQNILRKLPRPHPRRPNRGNRPPRPPLTLEGPPAAHGPPHHTRQPLRNTRTHTQIRNPLPLPRCRLPLLPHPPLRSPLPRQLVQHKAPHWGSQRIKAQERRTYQIHNRSIIPLLGQPLHKTPSRHPGRTGKTHEREKGRNARIPHQRRELQIGRASCRERV